MKIKTDINEKYNEIELHVCNHELSEEVKSISGELHLLYDKKLSGMDEKGNRRMLRPVEIFSFYSEGQRVIALSETERFTVQSKLYELEEELEKSHFIRISKSEIVNFRKIRELDMSVTGTIRIIMKNGYETYASRRNVAKLKEKLKAERTVNKD